MATGSLGSRFAAAALVAALGLAAAPVSAKDVNGTMCRVKEVQVVNPGGSMIREKLWGYTGDKAPYDPLFGWVEVACADRGLPRSPAQDLGRRIWFNVAGPKAAGVDRAKLSFDDQQTRAEGNTLGLTIDGLNILGEVSPDHTCVFIVSVWSETCPAK